MLYNKHNVPAQFSWTPVVGKEGTAFSVRPARGMGQIHAFWVFLRFKPFKTKMKFYYRVSNIDPGDELIDTKSI